MTGARQNLHEYLKRVYFGDRFLRRNPLYYGSIRRQLDSLQGCTLAERKLLGRLSSSSDPPPQS